MQTKYIGTILDGRWEVIGKFNRKNFKLKNIYNGTIITIGGSVFYRILKNETTVSKVISSRINSSNYIKQKKFTVCNKKINASNKE